MKKASKTPPMGWNSWDCYGAAVNESQLLANARYMAENLKDYGWEYVVCDIQWYEPTASSYAYHKFTELCMDEYSRLIPAENRFPSSAGGVGFKAIADEIHAMGLKFGIHIMRGIPRQAVHRNTKTVTEGVTARDIASAYSICAWNTDMYGVNSSCRGAQEYYDSLLELYASWGVDYIKCDDISNTEYKPLEPYSAKAEIEMLRRAIEKTGRDIVLSLSPGPAPIEWAQHLSDYADMWRMSGDFWDNSDALDRMFALCYKWNPIRKEGAWPDCDMLPLGTLALVDDDETARARKTHFTPEEQKTVMNLWCIFRSPLMFGGEMTMNDEFTLSLITNRELLEINQYSSGNRPLYFDGKTAVWCCSDKNNKPVLGLFNLKKEQTEIAIPEEFIGKTVHEAGTDNKEILGVSFCLAGRESRILVTE